MLGCTYLHTHTQGVAIDVPALELLAFQRVTGTSISAAFVTGSVARLISEGVTPRPAILKYRLLLR